MKVYFCDICGKRTPRYEMIELCMEGYSTSEERLELCPMCTTEILNKIYRMKNGKNRGDEDDK